MRKKNGFLSRGRGDALHGKGNVVLGKDGGRGGCDNPHPNFGGRSLSSIQANQITRGKKKERKRRVSHRRLNLEEKQL